MFINYKGYESSYAEVSQVNIRPFFKEIEDEEGDKILTKMFPMDIIVRVYDGPEKTYRRGTIELPNSDYNTVAENLSPIFQANAIAEAELDIIEGN